MLWTLVAIVLVALVGKLVRHRRDRPGSLETDAEQHARSNQ
ncbi:hypothetical protein [Herbihabitans rhizosphaerae]|nr:hypothetical protein [Herbihabitans rhizosphaerae]